MTCVLAPKVLDSFVERTVEALPDGQRSCAPCCESIGRSWQQLGLRPGDLVLLCLPNCKELLNQFFGVLMAQGVPALLSPMTPVSRLREVSQAMGARAIAAFRLPIGDLGAQSFEAIGRLQIAMLPPSAEPIMKPGEVVMLTSGTSGFASGCVFDLDCLVLNGQRHADSIGQLEEDTVLISLPLHFSFALVAQALASLVRGSRLIIGAPPFNRALYRKTLASYGVTVSSLTPVLIQSMYQSDADFVRKLRVLTVGGDAIEPNLVSRLMNLRQGGELYLTYGLTQAGPRVSTLAAHAEPSRLYGSVGRALAGTAVFLQETADGSGLKQLYVSSETVMKRSIGRVEGRPEPDLVAPKTVATGDAFDQDDGGYLFFKGRLCDFISRQGEKISLAAVRRLVSQLPHVVSAKTTVVGRENGSEDFDLELCLNSSTDAPRDPREMLRGLLKRSEMPRSIQLAMANKMSGQGYK